MQRGKVPQADGHRTIFLMNAADDLTSHKKTIKQNYQDQSRLPVVKASGHGGEYIGKNYRPRRTAPQRKRPH
jgi:hypothetical protein